MCVFSITLRTLNCMVGQMKHILATEQKKTDFKPEDENNVMIQYTTVRDTASTAELTCKTYKSADATRKSLCLLFLCLCTGDSYGRRHYVSRLSVCLIQHFISGTP